MNVYSLSIHARYQCGHSGACCNSGWPIPVERDTCHRLQALIAAGSLSVPRASRSLVFAKDAPRETPALAAVNDSGSCAFYEKRRRRCAIHRQAGEALLPLACRQFPRVSLLDGRGLFVNVSHYCPTATALLFDDGPLEIVESPAAFPASFPHDPLDARDALPPLLRPDCLLDLDDYAAWEREVVNVFADDALRVDEALAVVTAITEDVREWKPVGEPFHRRLETASRLDGATRGSVSTRSVAKSDLALFDLVLSAVPESLRPRTLPSGEELAFVSGRWPLPSNPAFDRPVRRYLAAKAFGSWLAYQGRGLRTIVQSLAAALALVRIHFALESEQPTLPAPSALAAAIRRSDEMLVHLASRESLAAFFSKAEYV